MPRIINQLHIYVNPPMHPVLSLQLVVNSDVLLPFERGAAWHSSYPEQKKKLKYKCLEETNDETSHTTLLELAKRSRRYFRQIEKIIVTQN